MGFDMKYDLTYNNLLEKGLGLVTVYLIHEPSPASLKTEVVVKN